MVKSKRSELFSTNSDKFIAGGGGRLFKEMTAKSVRKALNQVFAQLITDDNVSFSLGEVLHNSTDSYAIFGFTLCKDDNYEIVIHLLHKTEGQQTALDVQTSSVEDLLKLARGVGMSRVRYDKCDWLNDGSFLSTVNSNKYLKTLRASTRERQQRSYSSNGRSLMDSSPVETLSQSATTKSATTKAAPAKKVRHRHIFCLIY